MKLIEDWKRAWSFLSVQANAIGIAICTTYAAMYDQLKDTLPPKAVAFVTAGVFVAGIIGRVTAQKPPAGKDAP